MLSSSDYFRPTWRILLCLFIGTLPSCLCLVIAHLNNNLCSIFYPISGAFNKPGRQKGFWLQTPFSTSHLILFYTFQGQQYIAYCIMLFCISRRLLAFTRWREKAIMPLPLRLFCRFAKCLPSCLANHRHLLSLNFFVKIFYHLSNLWKVW